MTARICKDFNFIAGVHFNDQFYMNSYNVTMFFNVETDSIEEQNIALNRINYLYQECFSNSIFIKETEISSIEKYLTAGFRVCTLPEEPYDQIIGVMVMVKSNSITERKLVVTDVDVSSVFSDGVSCLHSIDENIGPFNLKGWWNETSPKISSIQSKSKKIVTLVKQPTSWDELNLGWEENKPTVESSEIVFVSFDKLEK